MDTSEKGWFFTILLAGSFLLFVFGVFVVWLIVAFQQKLLKKELLSQKELTKVSIDAQEKERERIAQELHDEVSAMLSAAKMQVAYLPYINDEQKRKESLAESKKMLETSLNQIRNLSHQLSPSILVAFGLENSIQNYLQSIKDLICIDFIYELPENLPHDYNLALYRIILELCQNTLKHADAQNIGIFIFTNQRQVFLRYQDDGKGIDKKLLSSKKTLGLRNIESRVNALNGEIDYLEAAKGVSLQVTLPYPENTTKI